MTSHTIWTTKGRYVSGAPCRALKLSFSASRYRTRLVTSTSCSVHACGEVARLRTMCSAIERRMMLSFTSSHGRHPAWPEQPKVRLRLHAPVRQRPPSRHTLLPPQRHPPAPPPLY